jgi:hypothetical protein
MKGESGQWAVDGGQWAVDNRQAQVIVVVQFAICNLQLPICNEKTCTQNTLKPQYKDLIQHLSLFISHSPLKLPSGIFQWFRVPWPQTGVWYLKKSIRRLGWFF